MLLAFVDFVLDMSTLLLKVDIETFCALLFRACCRVNMIYNNRFDTYVDHVTKYFDTYVDHVTYSTKLKIVFSCFWCLK